MPATLVTCIRPPSRRVSTLTACSARTRPCAFAEEPFGRHRVDPLAALFVRRRGPEDVGPLRPGVVRVPRVGRPLGSSSNWWTDSAPCRWAVPRQSAPVSPPPMITTRLPSAEMISAGATWSPASRRFCWVRYSTAKWTPPSSRPGIWRSRAHGVPPAEHDRVELPPQAGYGEIDADLDAGPELDAFGRHQRQPAIDEALFELELGNAVPQQAADAIGPFEDRHVMPGRLSWSAAASPAGPEPTTATRLPVRTAGGRA